MDQDQAAAISLVHQNSVPSVQMQCRITAILRAIATRAFFDPMRLASRVPQALSGDQRCTFVRRTLAASYKHVRVNRSPHFELLYTGVTRGKRLVVLVGQKKAIAIAVRNVSGRRRWSKLDEWLRLGAPSRSSSSSAAD